MEKVALVTGASTGIGRELSGVFAREHYDLVIVARSEAKLQQCASELQKEHGDQVKVIAKDLSLPRAPEEIFSELQREGVQVDVLVNNAGFGLSGSFLENDPATELAMLQVNVVALTHLAKLFLPGMIARRQGRLLNVSSLAAFSPGPFSAVYSATKAYVLSFSQAIAQELVGTGVTVTVLCPGAVRSEFAARAGMADMVLYQRAEDPAGVAEAAYRGLVKGQWVVIPGFANRMFTLRGLMPRRLRDRVRRRLMSRVKGPDEPQSSIRPA